MLILLHFWKWAPNVSKINDQRSFFLSKCALCWDIFSYLKHWRIMTTTFVTIYLWCEVWAIKIFISISCLVNVFVLRSIQLSLFGVYLRVKTCDIFSLLRATVWSLFKGLLALLFSLFYVMERFSNDCRKTKTKAITPTNHNRSRQRHEPITIPSNYR